jgi:two-component system nitrate/nitrite response regulator NarL
MELIRIGIIAPNELVRAGIRGILSDRAFDVRAGASTIADLANALSGDKIPHIILIDDVLTDIEQQIGRAREVFPEARLALFLNDFNMEEVIRSVEAGVDGVLTKELSCGQLAGVLKLIALGQRIVPPQFVDALVHMSRPPASSDWEIARAGVTLSDREIETLECLVAGDANKVIGRRLNITETTVKVHVKAILRKLRVANRTQAAIWAVMRGLDPVTTASGHQPSPAGLRQPIPLAAGWEPACHGRPATAGM